MEHEYLEKAVNHFRERFEKRKPIQNETEEYLDLLVALYKCEALDEIQKASKVPQSKENFAIDVKAALDAYKTKKLLVERFGKYGKRKN